MAYGFNLGQIDGLDLSVKTLRVTFDEMTEVEFELYYWFSGQISWNATAPESLLPTPQTGGEWNIFPNYNGSGDFVLMGEGIPEMAGETHVIKIVGDKVSDGFSEALNAIDVPLPDTVNSAILEAVTSHITEIASQSNIAEVDFTVDRVQFENSIQFDGLGFAIMDCVNHPERQAYLYSRRGSDASIFTKLSINERIRYAATDIYAIVSAPERFEQGPLIAMISYIIKYDSTNVQIYGSVHIEIVQRFT